MYGQKKKSPNALTVVEGVGGRGVLANKMSSQSIKKKNYDFKRLNFFNIWREEKKYS